MTNKETCICIPARYASNRFHGKLLKKFNEKTCIELTYEQCLKCENVDNIFILTDDEAVVNVMSKHTSNIIMTGECKNGTERISKNLDKIPDKYKFIVNVQADEPFIDYRNIDYVIQNHINNNNDDVFYSTLHEVSDDYKYIKSLASLKVVVDRNNNALYYSRNVIPFNKLGKVDTNKKYNLFTGIYVFNRKLLSTYHEMDNTDAQLEEDCEQLKILEYGYKIKTFPAPYPNEISLNTEQDYEFLLNKYVYNKSNKINFVVFDLDGVFTDGKIYIMENQIMKCYNGKDTYGLKLLIKNNYKLGLITAHETNVVNNMEHIVSRMDKISMGSYTKIEVLDKWLSEYNLNYSNVAYIGDDIPDLSIIEKVGFSACPANAVEDVKKKVDYICKNNGGDGAVREFCEKILLTN